MPDTDDLRARVMTFLNTYGYLLAALLIELVVFESIVQYKGLPTFLSGRSLFNILDRSAVYGVIAVGMTFVILTAGIDLSVGSLIAFGCVICAKVVINGTGPAWLWILGGYIAALAVGALCGLLSGVLITRFDIPPFIATLAFMSSLRGLGYIIADGRSIAPLPTAYTYLGRYRIGDVVPVSVLVMITVFVVGAVLLNMTRFGRHVRAIGGNEESARLSGVHVARVKCLVYIMCAALAVLGGLIVSSMLGAGDPVLGMGDELQVIAAVVVGGTSLAGGRGTMGGTFLGLLIIAVLSSGLNWIGVETFTQQVILGVVILAAVLLDQIKERR